MNAHAQTKPALCAIATYCGPMTLLGEPRSLHLWTLLTPLPGLMVGSTYAEETLLSALAKRDAAGTLPAAPSERAARLPLYVANAGD